MKPLLIPFFVLDSQNLALLRNNCGLLFQRGSAFQHFVLGITRLGE